MDKNRILELLGPFIRGEVPHENPAWQNKTIEIAGLIPKEETTASIEILKGMFGMDMIGEIPGAEGVAAALGARLVEMKETKEGRREKRK